MKTTSIAPVLLILLAVTSVALAQDKTESSEWIEVRPPGTRLVVQMPAEPRHQEQVMSPKEGVEITQHQYVVTMGEDKHTALFFNHHDLPEVPIGAAQIRQILDSTVGGMVARVDGTAKTHKEIEYRGQPGREVVFHFSDRKNNQYVFHSRIYLRGDRMYQLNVVSTEPNYSPDVVDKFFESFKFTSVLNEAPEEKNGQSKTDG